MMKNIFLLIILASCSGESVKPVSPDSSIKDADGNIYHEVVIRGRVWLKENLKTRHYANGDSILTLSVGFYSWAMATDSRGLCPKGYHIPSGKEFDLDFKEAASSPLGFWSDSGNQFFIDGYAYFWTSTPSGAGGLSVIYGNGLGTQTAHDKNDGLCLRCIK